MICKECGREIPSDSRFCPNCRAKIEPRVIESNSAMKFCFKCGSNIPADSRFCPECRMEQPDISVSKKVVPTKQRENKIQKPLSKKNKNTKKRNIIIITSIILVLLSVVLLVFSLSVKPTIDLNDYLAVYFEGYDTVGEAYVSIDMENFHMDYEDKLSSKINKKSPNKKKGFKNLFTNIKNVNDYDDYDHYDEDYISASMTFMEDCVNGKLDFQSTLSNGDVVKFIWDCNDEHALEKYGYKLKYDDVEYIVENLSPVEVFDPFEGVEVRFEGIAPDGWAEINFSDSNVSYYDLGLYFYIDKEHGLSNGDTVKVIASHDYADTDEFFAENYGMVPLTLSKEYTVDGLYGFAYSIDEIPEYSLIDMQYQADDVYRAHIAKNWGDGESLRNFTYMGNILLTNKADQSNNFYLVYQIEVDNEYFDEEEEESYAETNLVFWYISYNNIYVSPEGEVDFDLLDYETPNSSFVIDSGIGGGGWYSSSKSWEYRGYQTMDNLIDDVITSNLEYYNYEVNIDY